jgi:AcrR family transcriptional regulator
MARTAATSRDLRDACVETAHALIVEHGIERLSLRDVARRLGVSHQAPYRHYPSRDHLLAEVLRRCFERFAAALAARERFPQPLDDMRSLGRQYLLYALRNPVDYRLMFGGDWPEAANHPGLLRDAQLSFEILRQALAPLYGGALPDTELTLNALFVWSSMHGLATLLQSNAMAQLALGETVLSTAVEHIMDMVEAALAMQRSAR